MSSTKAYNELATFNGTVTFAGAPKTSGLIDGTAADILSTGTQAAGANGVAADSGHVHPNMLGSMLPGDNGLLGQNFPIAVAASNSATITKGAPVFMKLVFRAPATVTNLWFLMSTTGSGASTGTVIGLYSSAGTLLTTSADFGTSFTVAAPAVIGPLALTTPQSFTAGQFCWAAILTNLATTQPTLYRSGATGSVTVLNAGLTAATFMFASQGTLLTALAGSITPSSNATTNAFSFWVGWT